MKIFFVIPAVAPNKGGPQVILSDIAQSFINFNDEVFLIGEFNKLLIYPKLLEKGVKIIKLKLHQSIFIQNIKFVYYILKYKPDIIHVSQRAATVRMYFFNFFIRKQIFCTIHNDIYYDEIKRWTGILQKIKSYFYKKALESNRCTVIVISKRISDSLNRFLGSKRKSYLIFNGIDTNKIEKRKNRNLDKKITIAFVGRMSPEKDPIKAIDFIDKLINKNISFEFHFFGDGVLSNKIKETIFNKKYDDFVFFHGNVEDMLKRYSNIDIMVNFCKVEGFSIAVLEAMLSGVVVVAQGNNTLDEILIYGYNGFLIKEDSLDSFVEIIIRLFNNKILFKQISENARSTVFEKYSIDKIALEYRKIFLSLFR